MHAQRKLYKAETIYSELSTLIQSLKGNLFVKMYGFFSIATVHVKD